MKLHLGIVCTKNRELKNHRSLLKIILNPFLRKFCGICIGSVISCYSFSHYRIIISENNKTLWENIKSSWVYELEDGDYIIPVNRVW